MGAFWKAKKHVILVIVSRLGCESAKNEIIGSQKSGQSRLVQKDRSLSAITFLFIYMYVGIVQDTFYMDHFLGGQSRKSGQSQSRLVPDN